MNILIAGAGSVGRLVAKDMTADGHHVTIIDVKHEAMRVASVPQADWVLGDACDVHTLTAAGAGGADAVVATTGDDKANLVISLLAKTEFGVPRVIARVSHQANAWLFDETWGVDVAVSTPHIMSEIIEEAITTGRLVRRMQFQSGASLYQGTVAPGSEITRAPLGSYTLPPDIVITTIIRDGVPLAAAPDMSIEAADQLIFIVGPQAGPDVGVIEDLLQSPQAEDFAPSST
ncbi:potassium channel family protein [Trueperella bialowiezensis]|uniref:Trk system potassium uptake protein TrkA n=1 Tax=Trueperella bialowiezensis TaxID=312285 RepID=A0A3S4UXT9_9ACTO|nr:TrkA family potassium uptake protein [Trueperella bialowiezensis]VEI12506.1 Trk system potassium uptake protein trkA [Trueperella bialowiezensis]